MRYALFALWFMSCDLAHAQMAYPPQDLGPYALTTSVPLVQATTTTLGSGGTFSVTWSQAFVSSTPFIGLMPVNPGSNPIICNISSSTTTSVSGACWTLAAVTLPGVALSLLGFVINVYPQSAAGTVVRVIGRDLTQ